jgi:transcriptional regulator with AAA-type ATPase domain
VNGATIFHYWRNNFWKRRLSIPKSGPKFFASGLKPGRLQLAGNARELENVAQRGVALSDGGIVDVCNLPSSMRSARSERQEPVSVADIESQPFCQSYEDEVKRFKRALILRTLQQCNWRKAECARTLGVARGYLHRLINQLEFKTVKLSIRRNCPPRTRHSGR